MDEKVFRGVSLAMVQEQAKTIRYLPEDFCCINVLVVGCGLEGVRCPESRSQGKWRRYQLSVIFIDIQVVCERCSFVVTSVSRAILPEGRCCLFASCVRKGSRASTADYIKRIFVAYMQVVFEKVFLGESRLQEQVKAIISNEYRCLRAGCFRKGVPWWA